MLDNLSISKKIGGGFAVCIIALVALAVISWVGFNTAGSGFSEYREIARDNVLMGRIQANLLEARLQVKNFIQTGSAESNEKFDERFASVEKFVNEAETSINDPERAALVDKMKAQLPKYHDAFDKVVELKAERNHALNNVMIPEGEELGEELEEFIHAAERENQTQVSFLAADVQESMLLARLNVMKFLDSNSEQDAERVRQQQVLMERRLTALANAGVTAAQIATLTKINDHFKSYMAGFEKIYTVINTRNGIIANQLDKIGPKVADMAEDVKLSIKKEQDSIGPAVEASNDQNSATILTVSIATVLLGIFLAVVTAKKITTPIYNLKENALEIAKGDLDQDISVQQGDEIGQLADAFRDMVSNLKAKNDAEAETKAMVDDVIAAVARTAGQLQEGKIDSRAISDGAKDEYADMLVQFNGALDAVIEPLKVTAEYVARISQGDIPSPITREYKGEYNNIKLNLNQCIGALSTLIAEMSHMSKEHDLGDIDVSIDVSKFEGAFAEMAQGTNNMVNGHIAVKKKAMACVKAFGEGNFDAPLEKFPGKKVFINDTIEQVRTNLKALIRDVNELSNAAISGKLSHRADASQHSGDFQKIIVGINDTLNAILEPINEAAGVLEKLANYDLRARVQGNYSGDHAKIKESLNSTGEALHSSLVQVADAVEQIASVSQQIASGSQQVAEGASEQASSLEETSSSLEEIAGMTRQNAENTQQAKTLAESTHSTADTGAEAMSQMLTSMGEIKQSAESTSEIIKDINEIAFQTNLLALNAAVEAARAGDAGRGFAVVAEEVRNLAGRAKEAAQNTEELIKRSVVLAGDGEKISIDVNDNLAQIVGSVGKVTDIVGEIAIASQEQTKGITQVNTAMAEMDKVVQQAAANSEESSSASEELSGQAQELRSMVERYQLDRKSMGVSSGATGPKRHTAPMQAPKMPVPVAPEMMANPLPMDDDDPDFAEF